MMLIHHLAVNANRQFERVSNLTAHNMHKPLVGPSSGMKFLVIDDSPIDRLVLTRALGNAFPAATLCAVGSTMQEFEDAIETEKYDLVLIDYALGWGDGFEVIRSVRKRSPDCAAILLTMMPSDRLFSQAITAGFDVCLTKSSSLEHLTLAVEGVLGGSHSH
jgi:DNA-binding NarL/FixJ family response regulator